MNTKKEEAAAFAQDAAPAHVRVTVNGEDRRLPANTTLAAFLAQTGVPTRFVAVAVNRKVIRRAAHPDVVLREGDAVEIVRMVGGGAADSVIPANAGIHREARKNGNPSLSRAVKMDSRVRGNDGG